jgi:MarR family transcriptional regulator, lower aerobic nicotinate degradation pathway regulator
MAMDELYTKPGHLIRRMQQIAVAIFMEECATFDLTPVQYAAMVAIREYPGIDATRLSALVAFDRSTLGSVIGRLEAKEFILRRPSTKDSRVKLLYLTPLGKKTIAAAAPLVERAQGRMVAPLNAGDRRKFIELLSQLVHLNNETSRAPQRAIGDVLSNRATGDAR